MPLAAPRYTVDQVRAFPEDGQRYELLDGVLLVSPGPRNAHQLVVMRLACLLQQILDRNDLARVVSAGEMEIGTHTLLNPDILVYPARFPAELAWKKMNEWWLVVEVESPSTRVYDREFKRPAYQALGVDETWLVDLESKAIKRWLGRESQARLERTSFGWRPVRCDLEIPIDPALLFRGL